jgi:hypothetical protein
MSAITQNNNRTCFLCEEPIYENRVIVKTDGKVQQLFHEKCIDTIIEDNINSKCTFTEWLSRVFSCEKVIGPGDFMFAAVLAIFAVVIVLAILVLI